MAAFTVSNVPGPPSTTIDTTGTLVAPKKHQCYDIHVDRRQLTLSKEVFCSLKLV